ncbi:hypothetical protein GT037_007210 [Alternaria burnsii]|uniref:Heterokaryon incompatibility domain-containing protein n=1 Tax=Alternaria burnsii TaxID=1187904 RepID=A0A8H7B337_9PLEO|nr:uncharacterized protein GT037_007210 [Alternaria burnsii]KAF7674450.1 hypothetical protein GT037_007210 [Alternaria burnsii]
MPKCRLCNDFQRSPRQFRLAFDCSQKELIQSANGGCIICSYLLEGLQHFEPKLEALQGHDRIHIWGGNIDGGGAVEMEVFSGGALRLRLEFFNTKGKTSVLQGARMLPTIPGDTRAPASIDWAKQRLQECVDSHASCSQESIPKLPTRVLDLRPDADDMNVRLITTQGLNARYACLSHRWGRSAALQTLKCNYVSHTQGIGWDMLPKTFLEATLIAQDLGLRYLWIDSLCIIQDDEDDKSHEIAAMSSIYTNSYITIAATHSESSMHGCYSTGSLHHQDYPLSSSKQRNASVIGPDLYVREEIAHIGEERATTPLLKRGWVCQERLLSPRVLHFCEKELVWECQESSTCQCSCFNPPVHIKRKYMEVFRRSVSINDYKTPNIKFSLRSTAYLDSCDEEDGVDVLVLPAAWTRWLSIESDDDASGPRLKLRDRMRLLNDLRHISYAYALKSVLIQYQEDWNRGRLSKSWSRSKNNDDPTAEHTGADKSDDDLPQIRFEPEIDYIIPTWLNDEAIRRWRYVVSDYTGMDLTEQRDRLPAIAGVASQFGNVLGGRYLAGLWEIALPGDLLWRTHQCAQCTPQYRAPSWSWASLDGRIKHYKMTSYHPEFSIVRALYDPLSENNPFGEVTSASLEINAIAANLHVRFNASNDINVSRRPIRVCFMGGYATFIPDYDLTMAATPLHSNTHDSRSMLYEFICIGDFDVERNDAAFSETQSNSGASLAVSLVIHRTAEGVYKRVGILERPRVQVSKSLQHTKSKQMPHISGTFIKSLHEQLRDSREKNGKEEAWKLISGLVLI